MRSLEDDQRRRAGEDTISIETLAHYNGWVVGVCSKSTVTAREGRPAGGGGVKSDSLTVEQRRNKVNKMSHKITLVYRIKDRIDMGFRIHIYSILFYPLFSLFFWRCLG